MTGPALGFLAQVAGQQRRALACYQAALRLDPRHDHARYNLAVELQLMGRLDDAIAQYRELASEARPEPEALYNLALALHRRGRTEEARLVRDRLRRQVPADPRFDTLDF